MDSPPVQLDIYRTAIPMRRFEHAAARRDVAEAIVAAITLADGTVGWGETLPRDYVTGETLDTVPRDIEAVLWPAVQSCDPQGEGLPIAACVHEMDYLLTWNCRHLANTNKTRHLQTINRRLALMTPILLTPDMLVREENNDTA